MSRGQRHHLVSTSFLIHPAPPAQVGKSWTPGCSNMDRVDNYKSENVSDDTAKILRAFLDNLQAEGKANLEMDLRSFSSDEEIRQHAASLVNHLLVPLKTLRPTPNISVSPRSGMEDSIENLHTEMTDSATRQTRLKRECLARDGNKCAITGFREISTLAPDDNTTPADTTECAYIIPFSLASWKDDREAREKTVIWVTLNRCFPSLKKMVFTNESINDHRNAITMSSDLHKRFRNFWFALEATEEHEVYKIKRYRPNLLSRLEETSVTFHQYHPDYSLPDPELLKVHATIARILHASGKAGEIEKVLRKQDETSVLASNGSTQLSAILNSTSLGRLQEWQQDYASRFRNKALCYS